MDILFIANLVPYPLDGGGKIKTFTTIQSLAKHHTIDLVCFYENENIEEAKRALGSYCRNISMLPIRVTTSENKKYIARKALKCLFTARSLSVYKYFQKEMCNEIERLMSKYSYNIAYFNILQVYSYKLIVKKLAPEIKTVLDTQNCETLILKRNVFNSKNILKKVYLKIEAKRLEKFEVKSIQDVDELILLSQEDKTELEKMAGFPLKATIIPIGVIDTNSKKEIYEVKEKLKMLFLGTLTWAPNNDGIIWFLEKVVPKLVKENIDFELYVVGKNPSERLKNLASQYTNIYITGYVDSVAEYYDLCDFMIVPLFFGSGQRVKIIEGFSRGMPIVSTKIGAEGLAYTQDENILIADSADEFICAIIKMKDDKIRKKISTNCRETYLLYYSPEVIEQRLNVVINRLQ